MQAEQVARAQQAITALGEATAALDPALRAKVVDAAVDHGRMRFMSAARYINRLPRGEVVLLTNADIAVTAGFDCGSLDLDKLPFDTVLLPQRQEADCHCEWFLPSAPMVHSARSQMPCARWQKTGQA